jgi:hypothetical protein
MGGISTFGEAIEELKKGKRVCRKGWNGKGMYLFYNQESLVTVTAGRPLSVGITPGKLVRMAPYIMMKTADEELTCVPWLASQTDILAEDWMVL